MNVPGFKHKITSRFIVNTCGTLHRRAEENPKIREICSLPYLNEEAQGGIPLVISVALWQEKLCIKPLEDERERPVISKLLPLDREIQIPESFLCDPTPQNLEWLSICLAHELGHWYLHAKPQLRWRSQLDLFDSWEYVTPQSVIFQPETLVESPDDNEARQFAAELLLPAQKTKDALHACGYYPPVIYKPHHTNLMSFKEYATRLAEKLRPHLSLPLPYIRSRLLETGLLVDRSQAMLSS